MIEVTEELDKKMKLFTTINTIDALSDQIESLLDLMQMAEDSVDMRSIRTASEMAVTMHLDMMIEVRKLEEVAMNGEE